MKYCVYGCGKEALFYLSSAKKWCCSKSHNQCESNRKKNSLKNKGRKKPEHVLRILKKFNEDRKNRIITPSIQTRIKLKETSTGRIFSKESREKQRQHMLQGGAKYASSFVKKETYERKRTYMLNGGAIRMLSFVKNPSKPQVELYNRIKELYFSAELNYPLYGLNYSLDIAIPDLKIWIESDGSYWHKDKEKDLERQRKIENLGWKCIRYKIDFTKDVPSIEKIKNDINKEKFT